MPVKKILISALLAGLCFPAGAADILRGPYVENVSDEMATVRFRTDVATVAWLSYGLYPDCERFLTLSPEVKEHKVALFGLLSDTTHCYRIFLPATPAAPEPGPSAAEGEGAPEGGELMVSSGLVPGPEVYKAAESSFKTFRGTDKPYFNFLAFGDSGSGSEEQFELARRMEVFEPDFAIHTGDLTDTGLDTAADEQYFIPYKKMLAKYPIFPALGNHDYGRNHKKEEGRRFLRENYSPFHTVPYTGQPPNFYFFDNGNARFFVLDTNYFYGIKWAQPLDQDSKQYKWLDRYLARAVKVNSQGKQEKTWKFVVLHEPMYSTGARGGIEALRATLEPLFEKYKVDLVFQGHDHNYERTRPIKGGLVDDAEGIVYITLGGGGSPLYFQRTQADWSEKFIPVYHFAYIEVKDSNLKMTVYDKDGKTIDTLEIQK